MNENRCVCCGTIIPEGTQVCVNCQKGAGKHKETTEERHERVLWDIMLPILFLTILITILIILK